MKWILSPGLRTLWILLIIIALAPAFVFTFRTLREARINAEEHARDNALRVARLSADRHQRLLESTQQELFLLSRLPALRSGDLEVCGKLFSDLLRQYPRYANLGIAGPDGAIVASGIAFPQPVSAAGRPWFQRFKENPEFDSGDYHLDEISGRPVVVLSHPVLDGTGKLRYVAFAGLDLGWANQILDAANLPQGSVLTISDTDGRILARTLDPQKWISKPGPEAGMLRSISAQRDATGESAGVDGIRRIYAFTQLPGRGGQARAFISVGIPVEAIYLQADGAPARDLMVFGLTAILALAAVWYAGEAFIGRGVRALGQTMKRLRSGDLSARAGIMTEVAEIRDLSRALDGLADSLQAQAEERERTQDTLRGAELRLRSTVERLPGLVWSLDRNLNVVHLLGEGVAGQKPQEANYRGLSAGTFMNALAPGFFSPEMHERALRGERVSSEMPLSQGSALVQIVPLRNQDEEIVGCMGVAFDISEIKRGEQMQSDRAVQLNQALDAAIQKITEYRRSEEATQQEISHLKQALRSSAQEVARHSRNEELLLQRERELKEFLESSSAEVAQLKRIELELRSELEEALQARETRPADAASVELARTLDSKVKQLEEELEAARGRNGELTRLEAEALEKEQQARASLDAANAEISRRTHMDDDLKESAKQIKLALEAAAGEVTELQDEVETLRRNEAHLQETLRSVEAKNRDLRGEVQSVVADFEEQKRITAMIQARDPLAARRALAQKLNEETSGSLATIKSGLEAMHKMAGKSPLAHRLKESIDLLETVRQRLRSMAEGLTAFGNA